MTYPSIYFTGNCFNEIESGNICIFFPAIAFDAITSIVCFIIGILGATASLAISPVVAYSLIGISCLITLAWITMVIKCCKNEAEASL